MRALLGLGAQGAGHGAEEVEVQSRLRVVSTLWERVFLMG
jgi:hypothetical protein